MRVLAFDASTEALSVALIDTRGGGRIEEIFAVAPREHAQRLLPAAERLLNQSTLSLGELDGLAFARGPGAFTGLRIAAGLVQGLALGAGLPVVGISTLSALAHRAFRIHPQARRVQVVQDARMGEIYTATFSPGDTPQQDGAERVVAPGDLPLAASAGLIRAGNGWALVDESLARSISETLRFPHAADVAELAVIAYAGQTGEFSAAAAVPVYIRDDVARKPVRHRK